MIVKPSEVALPEAHPDCQRCARLEAENATEVKRLKVLLRKTQAQVSEMADELYARES